MACLSPWAKSLRHCSGSRGRNNGLLLLEGQFCFTSRVLHGGNLWSSWSASPSMDLCFMSELRWGQLEPPYSWPALTGEMPQPLTGSWAEREPCFPVHTYLEWRFCPLSKGVDCGSHTTKSLFLLKFSTFSRKSLSSFAICPRKFPESLDDCLF